jgi:hypothetical protein
MPSSTTRRHMSSTSSPSSVFGGNAGCKQGH